MDLFVYLREYYNTSFMKRISLFFVFICWALSAYAQPALNSFLRLNEGSIKVSNTIENLEKSYGRNCIYGVKSIVASISGSILSIQYYMYINSWHEYDDATLTKIEFDLRTTDIYSGAYPSNTNRLFNSSGEKNIVTIRNDISGIDHVTIGQRSYNKGTSKWTGQGHQI